MKAFTQTAMRLAITDKKAGKRVFAKFLSYYLPTLDSVSDSFPAPDSFSERTLSEGDVEAVIVTPVYKDEALAYLQNALTQRIQGLARSRDAGGHNQCQNWNEIAESSSGGAGQYMAQLQAFKVEFIAYLEEYTELSEVQRAALVAYTRVGKLLDASQTKKERVAYYISDFVNNLGRVEVEAYESIINSLNRALETEVESVDF